MFCCIRGLFAIRVGPPFALLERTALAEGADSGSDARKRPSDRFSRYASDAEPTMMRSAASWRTVLECGKKANNCDIRPASAAIAGQDSTGGAHRPSEQASTLCGVFRKHSCVMSSRCRTCAADQNSFVTCGVRYICQIAACRGDASAVVRAVLGMQAHRTVRAQERNLGIEQHSGRSAT